MHPQVTFNDRSVRRTRAPEWQTARPKCSPFVFSWSNGGREERYGSHACSLFPWRASQRRDQRAERRESACERERRTSSFILPREKSGMRRGKSRHSVSSFRDFLIEGKAIPSGPHRHGPDYSNHYKGDENNSTQSKHRFCVFFGYLLYYFTENVLNILWKKKVKEKNMYS